MVGPPTAVAYGAEVTIRRIPDGPKDSRPDLRFKIPPPAGEAPAARTIYLDAGRWSAEVKAKGFVAAPQEITIEKGKEPAGISFAMGLDPGLRPLAFRVDVPADAAIDAVEVQVRSTSGAGEAKSCTIRPFEVNECRLLAEIGTWEVSASAPGFLPYRQVITLSAGQTPASYTLPLSPEVTTPPPEPEPEDAKIDVIPKPVRMRMAGGLNAGGLPLFVTGLGLAVYGSNTYDRAITADAADCASAADNYACRGDVIKAVRLRTAGLALVGTATGLFVTGLTAEFDVKPRVWYAELGAGGALLVGGAAWMAATTGGLNKELRVEGSAPPWEESVPRIDRATNQRLAAAMLMGTGVGLVTGSTIGLLVRKHFERRRRSSAPAAARLSPFTPIGGGGLMIQGRF
ncbi:MAG: hypothetical protein H6710_13605 [Myxococcales bacterium]|nr:hypothetical protein [Myxococcales bacterium]